MGQTIYLGRPPQTQEEKDARAEDEKWRLHDEAHAAVAEKPRRLLQRWHIIDIERPHRKLYLGDDGRSFWLYDHEVVYGNFGSPRFKKEMAQVLEQKERAAGIQARAVTATRPPHPVVFGILTVAAFLAAILSQVVLEQILAAFGIRTGE